MSTRFIYVTGFEASGMLGTMRIYMIWNKDVNRFEKDQRQWTKIYERRHAPSWNDMTRLTLEYPIRVLPGETCGFYIHSDRSDDRGLKYRSCAPGVVMEDKYVQILHGWAHTSRIPFDDTQGWYRYHRILSGNIFYEPTLMRWSPDRNHFWRAKGTYQAVLDVVLASKSLPPGVTVELMTFCPMDWFDQDEEHFNQRAALPEPEVPTVSKEERFRQMLLRRFGGALLTPNGMFFALQGLSGVEFEAEESDDDNAGNQQPTQVGEDSDSPGPSVPPPPPPGLGHEHEVQHFPGEPSGGSRKRSLSRSELSEGEPNARRNRSFHESKVPDPPSTPLVSSQAPTGAGRSLLASLAPRGQDLDMRGAGNSNEDDSDSDYNSPEPPCKPKSRLSLKCGPLSNHTKPPSSSSSIQSTRKEDGKKGKRKKRRSLRRESCSVM